MALQRRYIHELLNFEKTVEVTYGDVIPTDWYYVNVGKALAAGYISPSNLLFPNEKITRQEVVRILGVAYNLNDDSYAANVFLDSELIFSETKGYIGVLLENNLLSGYPDGTFKPTANITRAEVVKLIYNVINKLEDLPIKISIDKSELEEIIEEAEDLKISSYTSTTWGNLKDVLEKAIKVLEDEEATQKEVDKALDELVYAIENLKKVTTKYERDENDYYNSGYNLTKGTNRITRPVTIRRETVSGDVIIDYSHSSTLDLPSGLIIDGNLTVVAPRATVNNYATVKGNIIIKDVASTSWNEYTDGNTLVIEDENGMVLNIIGDVIGITLSRSASGVIVINIAESSSVSSLIINAKATIISPKPIKATISSGIDVIAKTNKDAAGYIERGTGDEVMLNPEVVPPKSKIATLSNLEVDGANIVGFSPDILTYNVEVSDGTTTVPKVDARVSDTGKANAVVIPASSLPGETIIVVTAEDGITTLSYKIYFSVADTTPPLGYSVEIDQPFINSSNQTEVSFTIKGAEVGTTFSYSILDKDIVTEAITGSGTISSPTSQVTGIDVSSLADDELLLSLILTDSKENAGPQVIDTIIKDTNPPKLDYTRFIPIDNPSPISDMIQGLPEAIGEASALVKAYLWTDINESTTIDAGELGPEIPLGTSLPDGSVLIGSIGDLKPGIYKIIITATDQALNESLIDETSGITIILTNSPDIGGRVSVLGSEKYGETLVADTTNLINVGEPTYQWNRDGVGIMGATASTYTLVKEDINRTITVSVTADNVSGKGTITSTPTGIIGKAYQAPPAAPEINYYGNDYVMLKAKPSHEYSRDGVSWQDGGFFGSLVEGDTYTFYSRIKETDTHLASLESPVITLTTKIRLGKVEKPIWGSSAITWDSVQNSSHYVVYIYKVGKTQVVDGEYIYSGTSFPITSFNSSIKTEGAGIYTVRVTALAPIGNVYSNGEESVASDPYVTTSSSEINSPTGIATITLGGSIGLTEGDIVVKKDGVELTYNKDYTLSGLSSSSIEITFTTVAGLDNDSGITIEINKSGYIINGGDAISIINTIPIEEVSESLDSIAITKFNYATLYATQAKIESKVITTSDFASPNNKRFAVSDSSGNSIDIDLWWNIPAIVNDQPASYATVVGSAVESYIQQYFVDKGGSEALMNRTLWASGLGDKFSIGAFGPGPTGRITISGEDASYFFDTLDATGKDIDYSNNCTFTINDGSTTSTITLDSWYSNMSQMVNDINSMLTDSQAKAEKIDETSFKLVTKIPGIHLTIDGTDKAEFFDTFESRKIL